jgi:hypothetical protein
MSWPVQEVWAVAFVQALESTADMEWESDQSRAKHARDKANGTVELLSLLGENDRGAHVFCPTGWPPTGDGTADSDSESGAGS